MISMQQQRQQALPIKHDPMGYYFEPMHNKSRRPSGYVPTTIDGALGLSLRDRGLV